jgi:hypothetical protein
VAEKVIFALNEQESVKTDQIRRPPRQADEQQVVEQHETFEKITVPF